MLHNHQFISVEEILVKRSRSYAHANIRKFILYNRHTNLKFVIHTLNARVVSCSIGDQHVILENDLTPRESNWKSHVSGFDTVFLTHQELRNDAKVLTYSLSRHNEFTIVGKGCNCVHPFYFNLNSVQNHPSLIDHHFHINTSHETSPLKIFNFHSAYESDISQFISTSPVPLCDAPKDFACVATPSTTPNSNIVATLRYQSKMIKIILQVDKYHSHLRIICRNGAIAIVPYNMKEFKIVYQFYW